MPEPENKKKTTPAPTPAKVASTPLCVVVGVGGSTGGYEAISALLRAMPVDLGVSLVIVEHLLPGHPGLSAQVYGASSTMPVYEAAQGTRIVANHVYTAPAGKNLSLHQGVFELSARNKRKNAPLPIDFFLMSLAKEMGAHAIAVVLSGNGSDGTAGVQSIAAEGGMVLVQTPGTAAADSMPQSAIATGMADEVLDVAKIPAAIADYIRHLSRIAKSTVRGRHTAADAAAAHTAAGDSKAIQNLLKLMLQRRGHDFSGYKRKTLLRRIARRMGLHALEREADYVALLKKDAKELEALFHDLLIGVTDFFRDPQAWELLESEVITPLVTSKKRDEAIRIWVPGCSTGEEAYSLAMVLLDKLRRTRKQCLVQIFATDTNQQALDVGRSGHYPASIASRIAPQRLSRYFNLSSDQKYYIVSDELRAAVVFGHQNLFSDPPFGRVDMISCRNVLIYLSAEVQKTVLNTFHFALRNEGYLFLGNAESNGGRDDMFKPLSSSWRIFQRVGPSRFQSLQLPLHGSEVRNPASVPQRTESLASQAAHVAQKLILERFAPASVLVNSQFEVLYFCGPTDQFLQRPAGAPTLELLTMVREGLRSRLHGALSAATANDSPVVVAGVLMKQGAQFQSVEMTVTPVPKPLHGAAALGHCFLVVFRHDATPVVPEGGGNAQGGVLVRHLEQELQATREDLYSTTERFEDSNERLRLSGELVLMSNEKLRALNEELESSKEELQSYNEEITTVNQQLEAKLRELETANNDTKNLLASSDIATICLDQALRIKWFAPAAQRLFGILHTDIGQPLSDVVSAVGDTQLLLSARAVLAGQTVRDAELLTTNGRCYMRRILLYKNVGQTARGLIVTYTDVTDSYISAQAVELSRRDLDETRERAEQLRVLSAALANAEERERRTLAKDLHDDLGQLLAVIGLKAAILQKQQMPDAVRSAVAECALAVQLANKKMRDIALQLNPPMLDQLGLLPAMQWLADEMHRLYQLDVVINDDGAPKPMEPAVSATLFRALRELLLNVAKHASVGEATITTEQGPDNTLLVTVSDAGGGLDPAIIDPVSSTRASGLIGIRERIGYLGGEMSIKSNPGVGTSVELKVPMLAVPALVAEPLHPQGTP